MAGAKLRDDIPVEQEAVRTTIVGGRPPGPGKKNDSVPRGIEVLIKKASVDKGFYNLLLAERSRSAKRIRLELDPSETMMLDGIPEPQLITIINNTRVKEKHIPAFMGYAAAAMLTALGVTSVACNSEDDFRYQTKGIDPDTEYIDASEVGDESENSDTEGSEDTDTPETEETGNTDYDNMKPTGIRPDLEYLEEGEDTENEDSETEGEEGEESREDIGNTGISENEETPGDTQLTRGVRPDIP